MKLTDVSLGQHRIGILAACLALGCDGSETPGGGTGGRPPNTGGASATGGTISSTGGSSSTGGKASGGTSSGGRATGGAPSGGRATGGAPSGGSPSGGKATGGTGATGAVPTCSGTKGTQLCAASSTTSPATYITAGKYWINNNWWGTSGLTGSQCIWQTCLSGDTLGWGTNFSWTTGATNSVKTYASVVFGWHYGTIIPNSTTGLPVQLSANRNVTFGWSFNVTQSGTVTQNVAYDLWLHTTANPSYSQAGSDEVMIWLYRSNGAGPAGTRQVQGLSLAGTTWDLYEGTVSSWTCHSFVRSANTTSASLNLMDFLGYLVSRGLSSSKYLTGVEAGTEVFTGTGQLDTNGFTCTIQ